MASSCHQTLRPPCNQTAAFNRRMRKTARTVVWEGAEAQSSAPDPIALNTYGRNAPRGSEQPVGDFADQFFPRQRDDPPQLMTRRGGRVDAETRRASSL